LAERFYKTFRGEPILALRARLFPLKHYYTSPPLSRRNLEEIKKSRVDILQ
jgi:HrpA-like RNA helicase